MARTRNQGSNWIRKEKRLAIYARDGMACIYCGRGIEQGIVLTLDHVVPCELGGSNGAGNLVTACLSCNSSKQDLPLQDFLAILRDRGVDTSRVGATISRQIATPIDMAQGKALLEARRAS